MPRKSSTTARRARERQAAGEGHYTTLLRQTEEAGVEPGWVAFNVGSTAPRATPEERHASAQILADALHELVRAETGEHYPAAANAAACGTSFPVLRCLIPVVVTACRPWHRPGEREAVAADVEEAIHRAYQHTWPDCYPPDVMHLSQLDWPMVESFMRWGESIASTTTIHPTLFPHWLPLRLGSPYESPAPRRWSR